MNIFNNLWIKDTTAILDGEEFPIIKGKHSIYAPTKELKFIFSHNGKITPFGKHKREEKNILKQKFNKDLDWDEDSLRSLISENKILKLLWKYKMGVKVGDLFYIKNLISDFPFGVYSCDPRGCYGFSLQNVNKLKEQGMFSKDRFYNLLIHTKQVTECESGVNDLMNEKRNNIINGYCIDVRRSIRHDLENLNNIIFQDINDREIKLIKYNVDRKVLQKKIREFGQYPFKKRETNYQDYYMRGQDYISGSRDTLYRMNVMGIPENLLGKTVVDLGCNIGSILIECYNRGAYKCTGMDFQPEYIECARDLARYNWMQLNFIEMDLTKPKQVIEYLNKFYLGEKIDYVFGLALLKHVKENLIEIYRNINFEVGIIEGHNSPDEFNDEKNLKTEHLLKQYFKVERIGVSNDRNTRPIWGIRK